MAAMRRPTAELRVPMVPVAVEIAGVDAPAAPCEVYVADTPRKGRHAVVDDLATLLESDPPFLPAKAGVGVVMLAKHAIRWVAYTLREPGDAAPVDGVPAAVVEPEPSEVLTLFDNKHEVEITLDDGSTLLGAFLHSSPADRPRVIDYLNRSGRFLRLWTSRAQYLVNKQHVARVREVD
jgi:hypothetical protein